MFQFSNYDILYHPDLHEAFTVFQTKVHLKSIITLSMMKSRKEKKNSSIFTLMSRQRYPDKTSIQNQVCIFPREDGIGKILQAKRRYGKILFL
jgi:hypothetical protein